MRSDSNSGLTKPPLVSIVILNWNGLEDTKICLEHVSKLDYANLEVIVVDNGSRADSKNYLKSLKNIIYVDNPVNRGFTGGHIDGLKKCSGQYVVLLNNDAVIKDNYIDRALIHFKNQKIAAVGGRSYWWDDDNPILDETNSFYSYQEVNIWTAEAIMLSSDTGMEQVVNNVSGSCVMIRKSVIDKLGYLYDPFFAYFEETDLFARIKRAGYTVLYDPALRIWHRNGASSGASGGSHFFYYQIFRNRFIFAMRNFETKYLFHFWLIYFKIAARSFLKLLLKRGDSVMNKAYAQAALNSIVTLPRSISSRFSLSRQLGKSTYNHIIFSEQAELSVIVNCSGMNQVKITEFITKIGNFRTDSKLEFVIITSHKPDQNGSDFIRLVEDKSIFKTNPLNLGCIVSKFNWMLVCEPEDISELTINHTMMAIGKTLGTDKHFIRSSDLQIESLLFDKTFFSLVGGLGLDIELAELRAKLSVYAKISGNLLIAGSSANQANEHAISKQEIIKITSQVAYDKQLQRLNQISWFKKIQLKYYRIYQLTTIFKWFFNFSIPIRLKFARLRNVVVFVLKLKIQLLATEIKHMRNEVVIYDSHHARAELEMKVVVGELPRLIADPTSLPVFIICRDRLEPLLILVSWLESHNLKNIVFIDNDSTYPPLLEYFGNTKYQLLSLARNVGHTSPWSLNIIRALVPEEFYIVSDPDVIPIEECPSDAIQHLLKLHKKYPGHKKVGFGLRIDDLPDTYPLKKDVIQWENQFFKDELEKGVYEAGIDTTFAVYKPFSYTYTLHPSLRTDYPYIARHLPWYGDGKLISEEERYYRQRANHDVSSWNTDELKARYAKEMLK